MHGEKQNTVDTKSAEGLLAEDIQSLQAQILVYGIIMCIFSIDIIACQYADSEGCPFQERRLDKLPRASLKVRRTSQSRTAPRTLRLAPCPECKAEQGIAFQKLARKI